MNDKDKHSSSRSSSEWEHEWRTPGDRIRSIRGYRSQEIYANQLSIGLSTLRRYEKNERDPDAAFLNAVFRVDGVLSDWILRGEGRIRPSDPDKDIGAEFAMVAHYDVEASAGGGAVVEVEPEIGRLAFRKAWIEKRGLSAKDLIACRIKGDSMSPTIRDGAIVLVDSRIGSYEDDGIYVLQYDGHLIAKRLQRDAIVKGVLIKSDNPAYETQKVSADQLDRLYIIGKVVWAGQEV